MRFLVRIRDRNGAHRERVVEAVDEQAAKDAASRQYNLARNGTILDVEPTSQPLSAYHKR